MIRLLLLALLQLFIYHNCFAQALKDTIIILPLKTAPTVTGHKIGHLKAGNNATQTHCDYEALVLDAKEQAAKMGGNVVKITELIPPALVSRCYKIKAEVYYAPSFRDSVLASLNAAPSEPATSAPHATLRLYRLRDTVAFSTAYFLHLDGDTIIGKAKSRWAQEIKLYKDGPVTLWAKTEARKELKLEVNAGETYYIRCGLVKGNLRNVPVLQLVDKKTGEAEYKLPEKSELNTDIKYLQHIR